MFTVAAFLELLRSTDLQQNPVFLTVFIALSYRRLFNSAQAITIGSTILTALVAAACSQLVGPLVLTHAGWTASVPAPTTPPDTPPRTPDPTPPDAASPDVTPDVADVATVADIDAQQLLSLLAKRVLGA